MSPLAPLARRLLPAAALAALLVSPGASATAGAPAPRCERVVLVVWGGGVRTKELLGRPDLLPTVREMAAAGFSCPGWAVAGTDHDDAAQGILTGRTVPVVTPGRARPAWPTVLEYARKGLHLAPRGAWLASYVDGPGLMLAASDHADYGDAYAPSLAYGEGPFGETLTPLFGFFGRPNPTKPKTWEILARLRAVSAKEAERRLVGALPKASAEDVRLERALLEEVDRRATGYSGPGGLDARAVRAAITVLRVFRPTLLVVRLGQADVAHRDLFAYWDVLKRDDAELARLRGEIAGDPALKDTTALILVPELGRNAEQNAAGGYDHDDGSPDATTVAVVAEGAGIRRGTSLRPPLDVRDLCPTIGRLLGFETPLAEGVAREDLLKK